MGHFKSTCAARISGQISGEFRGYPARGRAPNVNYPRARAAPRTRLRCRNRAHRGHGRIFRTAPTAREKRCIFKIRKRITLFFQRNWGKAFRKHLSRRAYRGRFRGEFCSYPARHARGRTPNVKYPRAAYPRRADGCASADGIARRARMNLLRALVALHGFSLHGNTTRFTSHGRNPRISAAFAYLARPAFRIPRIAALPPHRLTAPLLSRCAPPLRRAKAPLHRKKRSGDFSSRFSYSVYRFRQIPNPGR